LPWRISIQGSGRGTSFNISVKITFPCLKKLFAVESIDNRFNFKFADYRKPYASGKNHEV
jgi:hypothetical protein